MAAAGRGLRRRQSQPGRPRARGRRRFHSQHFRDSAGDRADFRAPVLSACDIRRSRPSARRRRRLRRSRRATGQAISRRSKPPTATFTPSSSRANSTFRRSRRWSATPASSTPPAPSCRSRCRACASESPSTARSSMRSRRATPRRPRGSPPSTSEAAGEDLLNLMRQARTIRDREARRNAALGARSRKAHGGLCALTRKLRGGRASPRPSIGHYCISLQKIL